jgi:hypothetical protein
VCSEVCNGVALSSSCKLLRASLKVWRSMSWMSSRVQHVPMFNIVTTAISNKALVGHRGARADGPLLVAAKALVIGTQTCERCTAAASHMSSTQAAQEMHSSLP